MVKKSPSTSSKIIGETYVATKAGFMEMIRDANARLEEGYSLRSVVPMGGLLGAVYVRERVASSGAFFSETPEEDAENW